jgi:hypothetical protein
MFLINDGAIYTVKTDVELAISTSDALTTGYQMKIWGDIQGAATEASAPWESYTTIKNILLTTGDGAKVVNLKIRDMVWNESITVTRTIILDTIDPIVTITSGPDLTVISKILGKDTTHFSFRVNENFIEFKVRIVPSIASLVTAGVAIPVTGGSYNMSGTGDFAGDIDINCTLRGADLAAAAGSDGTYIIKVFARDRAGNWSVV